MNTAYEVEHLTKTYRRGPRANVDISLTVERGEILGVLGPNGAGKTTLVRQLAGLLKPTSGTIKLFGHDIVCARDVVPRHVGYYGQKAVALRNHRVEEVLSITGVLRGLSTTDARRQANHLIERFDLVSLAKRRLAELSGGEQRLAVLLATFVGSVPVLILDEPTNELDPIRRRTLWDYLQEQVQRRATAVILTTHNLSEAENVVHRIAMIDHGQLIALSSPGELKRAVADHVRLMVRFREHYEPVESVLAELGECRQTQPGRWEIAVPRDSAAVLLASVAERVGMDAIDDFRLITPTLEDLYVHYMDPRAHT